MKRPHSCHCSREGEPIGVSPFACKRNEAYTNSFSLMGTRGTAIDHRQIRGNYTNRFAGLQSYLSVGIFMMRVWYNRTAMVQFTKKRVFILPHAEEYRKRYNVSVEDMLLI